MKPIFAKFDRFVVLTTQSGVKIPDLVILVYDNDTQLIALLLAHAHGALHPPLIKSTLHIPILSVNAHD